VTKAVLYVKEPACTSSDIIILRQQILARKDEKQIHTEGIAQTYFSSKSVRIAVFERSDVVPSKTKQKQTKNVMHEEINRNKHIN